MNYDEKERLMISHYFDLLIRNDFTEYDLLGFLIVLRRGLNKKKYGCIFDFSNLIAHRNRDRGIAVNAIKGAIQNEYQFVDGTKKIQGYHGIHYDKWVSEWKSLAEYFSFDISDETIHDITICVFSLAQNTIYDCGKKKNGKDHYHGEIELFAAKNREVMLSIHELNEENTYIWFASTSNKPIKDLLPINATVETFRENGILHLRTSTGDILF